MTKVSLNTHLHYSVINTEDNLLCLMEHSEYCSDMDPSYMAVADEDFPRAVIIIPQNEQIKFIWGQREDNMEEQIAILKVCDRMCCDDFIHYLRDE